MNSNDLYNVFSSLPGLETLTLSSRQPDQTDFVKYAIPGCRRRKIDILYQIRMGYELGEEVVKMLVWQAGLDQATATPPATLPPPALKVSDTLTDSSAVVWVIRGIEHKMLGNLYECVCQEAPG
jgi:hypothetical protein